MIENKLNENRKVKLKIYALEYFIELNNNEYIIYPELYKINSCLFYKVLNKRELDDMLNNCCKYIIEFISSIN